MADLKGTKITWLGHATALITIDRHITTSEIKTQLGLEVTSAVAISCHPLRPSVETVAAPTRQAIKASTALRP